MDKRINCLHSRHAFLHYIEINGIWQEVFQTFLSPRRNYLGNNMDFILEFIKFNIGVSLKLDLLQNSIQKCGLVDASTRTWTH
mmetsp:Transcript_22759/g.33293  ORF Transcript_22759/g.33293 Transcript_22759/m.33293 type:complete len:83 (-) Transcript_22759:113-361(-)